LFAKAVSEVGGLLREMTPTNDHEREIVKLVDQIALEGRLELSSIGEVLKTLSFVMTAADAVFLVNYIRWRMDHQIRE
jgi:hypothetical protein